MNRRQFTVTAVAAGVGLPLAAMELTNASDAPARLPKRPLRVPPGGTIRTAVAIGPGVNVIDMSGPWEVFQDAAVNQSATFELYTVAQDPALVTASGGLQIPKVRLVCGLRFVEHDRVASAGGLTSGIDLALRVVERYLGRRAADVTARYMEYRRQTS
jgi:hypothetical protein